ncbi:hypothetical protein GDO81_019324 [Engystomops pustulosus]|uniref:Uncharacterized protein n=1 Tax=Engystomops pustulosus TaxID=76066 RepID=A0AAV6Z231_ENGPU|nr:hypothetical protein GDO81_019324 [Engystomops pustulosus]
MAPEPPMEDVYLLSDSFCQTGKFKASSKIDAEHWSALCTTQATVAKRFIPELILPGHYLCVLNISTAQTLINITLQRMMAAGSRNSLEEEY